jgi:hypothetical protein
MTKHMGISFIPLGIYDSSDDGHIQSSTKELTICGGSKAQITVAQTALYTGRFKTHGNEVLAVFLRARREDLPNFDEARDHRR